MSNTPAAIAERNELKKGLLNLFQKNPGKEIDGLTICETMDISTVTKNKLLRELRSEHSEMRAKSGGRKRSGLYFWIGANIMNDLPALESKEPENPSINAEGYFDATAGAAINTVDKEIEKMSALPKFGDVMTAKHANGDTSLFFVLWSTDTQATGIYAIECEKPKGLYRSIVFFNIQDKTYRIDTREVCSKPVKYLEEKLFSVAVTTKVQVKHRIAAILDIQPKVVEKEKIVEKPVEKIVYKDRTVYREKPVEKIVYKDRPEVPEGYISKTDAVISDLLHQLDIYKDMVNRLAPLK